MTRAKTDLEKATGAAVRAYLQYMCDTYDELDPHQYEMLTRDLTIVAHFDVEQDECECPCCLGDYPSTTCTPRPI